MHTIRVQQVMYIEMENGRRIQYVLFNGETIVVYEKISNMYEQLKKHNFIYLSRQVIANPKYMTGFDTQNKTVIMLDNRKLSVAQKKWNEMRRQYFIYMDDVFGSQSMNKNQDSEE